VSVALSGREVSGGLITRPEDTTINQFFFYPEVRKIKENTVKRKIRRKKSLKLYF
jgi:hypothetical protein